jgi:hypothetical protein
MYNEGLSAGEFRVGCPIVYGTLIPVPIVTLRRQNCADADKGPMVGTGHQLGCKELTSVLLASTPVSCLRR